MIEKSRKSTVKNVSKFPIKTVGQNLKIASQQSFMTEMCRALFKYKNEGKFGWNNWLTT